MLLLKFISAFLFFAVNPIEMTRRGEEEEEDEDD